MFSRFLLRCQRIVVLTAVIGLVGIGQQRAVAADSIKESTSMKFVPADAAFYSTTLRMKEQYDAFVGSRAFAKIKSMMVVQMAVAQIQAQIANSPEMAWVHAPENQEMFEVLKEMVSQEVFIYGDNTFADLSELGLQLSNANRMGQMQNLMRGTPNAPVDGMRLYLKTLDANRQRLRTPSLVIGFKISGKPRAEKQLARLKTVVEQLIATNPDLQILKGRFKTTAVGGHKHLTLNLDGSLIPWNEVPVDQIEKTPGEFKKLFDKLKSMKLTVSLGLRGDYMLLGVGETVDHLKTLDGSTSVYDRKEFAPLRKVTAKKMTSISYVSERYARYAGGSTSQAKQMLQQLEQSFDSVPVDEKLKREFRADMKKVRDQLKNEESAAGATMAYSFQSDRGYETFTHNWRKNAAFDDSKPLSLLNHVGGNPILFFVSRSKYDPKSYELFEQVAERMFYYGEQIILSKLGAAEQVQYQNVRKIAIPLIVRLNKANKESLLPALKDGQSGFVLDAKISSRKWFPEMPFAGKPLPLPEAALVFGVSDAELLKKGWKEYFAVAQDFIDAMAQQFPNEVPPLKIPDPTVSMATAGTVYSYQQLKNFGVDSQIAPAAGLSRSVAVLSTSASQAGRVLSPKPVSLPNGFHTNFDRKLGAAGFFNWPAFVDLATPWIDYSVRLAVNGDGAPNEEGAVPPPDNPQTKMILTQVHDVVAVLKCFRGGSTIMYRENGANVSHSKTVWQDLKK